MNLVKYKREITIRRKGSHIHLFNL